MLLDSHFDQVLPGNRQTWDISSLLITTHTDGESDSEQSAASDIEGTSTVAPPTPELSDISKLLLKAKAAAEVGVAVGVV